jgi:hypothetical protein
MLHVFFYIFTYLFINSLIFYFTFRIRNTPIDFSLFHDLFIYILMSYAVCECLVIKYYAKFKCSF